MSSETSSNGTDHGPAVRCRNGSCDLIKPKTTVHESERKTLYRCPECRQVLDADWKCEHDFAPRYGKGGAELDRICRDCGAVQ